ncbi:MAG: PIN domain-containing protein [Verrucomicrobia bacterium]|nr:PIN domain-containing protein [Verrucomicrobiota bacterium]
MKHPLVLVDSSYYITWQNRRVDPLSLLSALELDYEFAINGIIWAEVLRGRSDPHLRDRYDRAFSLTRMLHLNASGWQRVARLAWELDRRGEVIPLADIIIGVTALEHQATVLTFDQHYQKIPGLTVVSDLE